MTYPYQVMGTTVPRLLGRQRLIEQIERHISKPSPDHVQVVGPRLFGKSVLLKALADRLVDGNEHYTTAAYVDLRHAPPADDEAFRRRFSESVKAALAKQNSDAAVYLDPNDTNIHEQLGLCFDELAQSNGRILVILDGFDHLRAGKGLTRNLLDQLRALAQRSSLRLITGSRLRLRELCTTEESRTSDFHEVFYHTPIRVGPFVDDDLAKIIEPLTQSGVSVDGSAQTELRNWSGGVPVLAAAILEEIANNSSAGSTVSKADIDRVAEGILANPPSYLQDLWDDCSLELRADVEALAPHDGMPLADLSTARKTALLEKGYGAANGARMRSACRLMVKYAAQQGPAVADLKRLFATNVDFEANIRGLLELRLDQYAQPGVDGELLSQVKAAIRDLESTPDLPLTRIRSIVNRALRLIWDAELPQDKKFPDAWVSEWKAGGERLRWLDDAAGRLPTRTGIQCNALRLATGADGIRPKAKFVTKPTYLLIESLHSVGDFGQHREDFRESTVSVGFAAGTILLSIELINSLTRDLARVEE